MQLLLWFSLLCTVKVSLGQQASETDLPNAFTLAAINTTLPNANQTGAPLVLGQNGAIDGAELHVTSTYASYPYDDYTPLVLINGSMRVYDSSQHWLTNATEVLSGQTLDWITSSLYTSPASQVYAAVVTPANQFPLLSAHGFSTLWSLCPVPGFRGQTNVVFNVSANIASPPPYLGYNPSDCYGVTINMIPSNTVL